MIYWYICEKFKLPVIPYIYETPNKNTPVETADIMRYLNVAFFEMYPFEAAIKKYVEKLNNSVEINSVKKSLAEIALMAPKIPVSSIAWKVKAFPFIVFTIFFDKSATKKPHKRITKLNNSV